MERSSCAPRGLTERKTYRRDGKISRERVISADMADRSSVSAPYEQLADTGDKLEWLRTMDEWTPADVRAPAPRPLRGAAWFFWGVATAKT